VNSQATRAALAKSPIEQSYEMAALIREVEQRLLELFSAGKLFGTVHTCIGQELVGVAVAQALSEEDLIFSNHRCHGHFLARTGNVEGLIAEIMGKNTGVCGGRGGSQHLCDRERGFFSNGIQGGIVPIAAGLAFAQQLLGTQNIVVVFIGDGTLGEGVVYEALNIAAKWQLPLLVVLENNGYAQSTPQSQNLAGEIAARAAAFDLPFRKSSTWEPESLLEEVAECVRYVRACRCPVFLQIDTYRLMAHSKGDDDRDPAEVNSFWKRDPLQLFSDENPEMAARHREAARIRVDRAVEQALDAPFAEVLQNSTAPGDDGIPSWRQASTLPNERAVARIRDSFKRNMKRDPRIVMLGEDIESPYGGAFKVTKDLSDEFPGRVRNTPISEASIVGVGNGLALAGLLPVCEIMFGDFLTLAADQLVNHSSKFRYMYNDQVRVPLIVRTPMGGRRGYGPTHSQSLEKHFLGLPNTQVLALHQRFDPGVVYDRLFADIDRPTLVIENKLLYGARLDSPVKPGFVLEHSDERFPTTRLRPAESPSVTIFCYGGMVTLAEEAIAAVFEEYEIVAELICPLQLYPLKPGPVIESVSRSHRLLVIEEGLSFAALGAELIAQLHERAPGIIRCSKRLAPPEHPIPSCAILENSLLPNVQSIITAIVELSRHA
jgi:2-oxoisovalerate dehydrogenase E1 component